MIPIIPMIDILAILLIFFILTSSFNVRNPFVRVALPKVTHLQTEADRVPRVPLIVLESGEIRLGEESYLEEELPAALAERKGTDPDLALELQMDENISLRTVLAVWEALTVAGIPVKEVPTRVRVQSPSES